MGERLPKGRILALDVGDKRIGIALSDEEAFLATGLPTVKRSTLEQDGRMIADLVREKEAVAVVLGWPVNMNGTVGPQAMKVARLQEAITACTQVPLIRWDERLTTVAAQRILDEAGRNWKRQRQVVDRLSAEIILQCYLDYLAGNPDRPFPEEEVDAAGHRR